MLHNHGVSTPRPEPGRDRHFQVVIVYEDYSTGRGAMDTYHLLLSRFGRELDFRISMWPFEFLQDTRFDAAIRAALGADAIIVAAHPRGDLPGPVKRWLQVWTRLKKS